MTEQQKFGISQSVVRREDDRLLRGVGKFIADQRPEGLPADGAEMAPDSAQDMAHGYVLRAPIAHGRLLELDVTAARAATGVLAVYTAGDLAAAGLGSISCRPVLKVRADSVFRQQRQPLLVDDIIRYVGEGLAFIVAETLAQARDAAELIMVDFDALPAVTDCALAAGDDAPLVWPDAQTGGGDNVVFRWSLGEQAAVEAAFAKAARIIELSVVNNRVILNSLETRGALGRYEPESGKLTLTTTTQMPHPIRDELANEIFHLPPAQIRVLVDDVGGSFGGKNALYPEYALTLFAARELRRPVQWLCERSEAFLSDGHGRDNVNHGQLAFDANHRILALRVNNLANIGAYVANGGAVSPTSGTVMFSNTYNIPAIYVEVTALFSHTVPTVPYRGAGRPEATYLVERLMDAAARALDVEPAELRRLNLIGPAEFPYQTATGLTYDACDFATIMAAAQDRAGWSARPARRQDAAARGRCYGIGMSNYVERCGGGGGLSETARLEMDSAGLLTLYIGTMSNGQGHETAYSQILNDVLGLPFENIRLVQGDTDQIASGTGTGGSWSIPMGGGAVNLAGGDLIEQAKPLAAKELEAAEADLEFIDGHFRVAGTDIDISLIELAGRGAKISGLGRFQPDNHTFPHGCHICEVEVDPETGEIDVIGYTAVHDFGRALNPSLLAGQVHGGVTQGIGQALMEHTVYDDDGQLLTGSYMDYQLPRADDLPDFVFEHRDTPTTRNPLGVKGCGEAGATGAPPAVINAIIDALGHLGVHHLDMPATPERVWNAIQQARQG